MTRALDHSTILIIASPTFSTFRLQKALEREGAGVCVTSLLEADQALHYAKPHATLIDFALASTCEDLLTELQDRGMLHLVCRSPNLRQSLGDQMSAAQDIAAKLSELLETDFLERQRTNTPIRNDVLDAHLYAM